MFGMILIKEKSVTEHEDIDNWIAINDKDDNLLNTHLLLLITRQYQEIYSLVGQNAKGYHLQVLAFSPFTKNHLNNQDLVQKENDQTYSINVNNWSIPGTGFTAVVRKK